LAGGCAGSSNEEAFRSALSNEQPSTLPARASSGAVKATASVASEAKQLTSAAAPGTQAYKIGPQDVLDISVFKVPELSTSVQVADTGTVNLALVGDVEAAGRTAQEVERDLVKQLGAKYLQRPQVRVFVKEYNSQRVTVEGAVKKPGVFPYRGRSTLLQTLAMAEGMNDLSDTNVVVFRNLDGKRAAAKFDIADIRSGKTADPQIESGDVVVVSTNVMKETFQNVLKALPLAGVFALL
jgi:polysaccharide export outer membrane protein